MRVADYLRPLVPSRSDYRDSKRSWRGDLVAGLTVGIVALPLALAFGVSSGAGAEAGLITAIIAGVVAAVFGGSSIQVSGPTGAMVVVLGPIVASQGVGAVAAVSVIAGVIVLLAGIAKIGRAVSFIPWPVIEGFTLGIAVIIFLQQVPAAIGAQTGSSSNAAVAAVQSFAGIDPIPLLWSLAAAATVAVIMILAAKVREGLPGSIIAIIVVSTIAAIAHLPLTTIGVLPNSLPAPAFPGFDVASLQPLITAAFTVAALAAIESLLSARVGASLSDTGPFDADRELVGQGLASIASGFFGGMPATGAIARTAVNVRSGARTRVAAIVHALLLLTVISLATTVVAQIPLAALAGVLMVTATRMISPATIRSVVGATRPDTLAFVLTALVTISVDLVLAVGIGVLVTAFFALRRLASSGGVHREELPGPSTAGDSGIALFRLDGALFFGAAESMIERITRVSDVSVVIVRMSQLDALDATGARVATEMIQALERRGITVLIKGLTDDHLQIATRVGLTTALRDPHHLFLTLDDAVAHARSHIHRTPGAPAHPNPDAHPEGALR